MEVLEQRDGTGTCIVWRTGEAGWLDLNQWLDAMLAAAIERIAAETAPESAHALEICFHPDRGVVYVFATSADSPGTRSEQLCYELISAFMEHEHLRISTTLEDAAEKRAFEQFSNSLWIAISAALRSGQASQCLRAARETHRLHIRGYNYRYDLHDLRLEDDGRLRM